MILPMINAFIRAALLLTAGLLGWTACSGSAPNAAPALQAPSVEVSDDAAAPNISGQYAGTIDDKTFGKAELKASLAQFRNAVGGSLKLTAGTVSRTDSVTWTVKNGTALSGSIVAPGKVACTFNVSGKYDATTFQLKGSYRAAHGCSAQGGTYRLKQKCYYPRDWAIRKDTGGLKQC
jgi:hypothetical protein